MDQSFYHQVAFIISVLLLLCVLFDPNTEHNHTNKQNIMKSKRSKELKQVVVLKILQLLFNQQMEL